MQKKNKGIKIFNVIVLYSMFYSGSNHFFLKKSDYLILFYLGRILALN